MRGDRYVVEKELMLGFGSHTRHPSPTSSRVYRRGDVLTLDREAPDGTVWFVDEGGARGKVDSGSVENMVRRNVVRLARDGAASGGKEYAIWGVPEGGSSEVLLLATPQGKPIESRAEANRFVKLLEEKYGARRVRVQEIDLSGELDWMKEIGASEAALASETLKVAKELAGSDVGEKVEFVADSFQMPFDVPGEREYGYEGRVTAQRGDALTVRLSSPAWAAGKVLTVSRREETLRIG